MSSNSSLGPVGRRPAALSCPRHASPRLVSPCHPPPSPRLALRLAQYGPSLAANVLRACFYFLLKSVTVSAVAPPHPALPRSARGSAVPPTLVRRPSGKSVSISRWPRLYRISIGRGTAGVDGSACQDNPLLPLPTVLTAGSAGPRRAKPSQRRSGLVFDSPLCDDESHPHLHKSAHV